MRIPSWSDVVTASLRRLRNTPEIIPRTEASFQPVASAMSAREAPSGRRNRSSRISALRLGRPIRGGEEGAGRAGIGGAVRDFGVVLREGGRLALDIVRSCHVGAPSRLRQKEPGGLGLGRAGPRRSTIISSPGHGAAADRARSVGLVAAILKPRGCAWRGVCACASARPLSPAGCRCFDRACPLIPLPSEMMSSPFAAIQRRIVVGQGSWPQGLGAALAARLSRPAQSGYREGPDERLCEDTSMTFRPV